MHNALHYKQLQDINNGFWRQYFFIKHVLCYRHLQYNCTSGSGCRALAKVEVLRMVAL
jgi:hypothetical protein